MMDGAAQNTDRELWRGPDEGNGSFYADSIHVTVGGGIGINCGGLVIVKPLRDWHRAAALASAPWNDPGVQWVCEQHPTRDFPHDDCAGPGMLALDALTDMERRKDEAYLERNQVVAALAKCFPSGTGKTAIEGWDPEWHGCVYIDLPTGQVSWHFHDSQSYLFGDLPPYQGKWDGHDTPEKYKRLAALGFWSSPRSTNQEGE